MHTTEIVGSKIFTGRGIGCQNLHLRIDNHNPERLGRDICPEKELQVIQLPDGIEDTFQRTFLIVRDCKEEIDVLADERIPPHTEHLRFLVPGYLVEERHVRDISPVFSILIDRVSIQICKPQGRPFISFHHGFDKVAANVVLKPAMPSQVIRYKQKWYEVSIESTVNSYNLFRCYEIHLIHNLICIITLHKNV